MAKSVAVKRNVAVKGASTHPKGKQKVENVNSIMKELFDLHAKQHEILMKLNDQFYKV